jgi:hypothetical protein
LNFLVPDLKEMIRRFQGGPLKWLLVGMLSILFIKLPSVSLASEASTTERITPLLMSVHNAPVPFAGSDGYKHLVYELWLTNFSSGEAVIEKVEVLGDNAVIETLDTAAVAKRLQPVGFREPSGTLAPSTESLLFLHLSLPSNTPMPQQLTHRITGRFAAAPPGQQEVSDTGGETLVDQRDVIVIGPPLRGERYIAGDSCCDASRHTRAALAVNGGVHLAQRFAVDWEQLDDQNRIYSGPREALTSYTVFGKEALSVADAKVVSVRNDLPEQVPGIYPTDISIDEADGNSVILDLGNGRYGLYAHLQRDSIKVEAGQTVKRGQVLGLVGNTGNSIAPHLHFHVMDTPSPLASNGLPYEIDQLEVTGQSPGTEAFDAAEANGNPLEITSITSPAQVQNGLPIDQFQFTFE